MWTCSPSWLQDILYICNFSKSQNKKSELQHRWQAFWMGILSLQLVVFPSFLPSFFLRLLYFKCVGVLCLHVCAWFPGRSEKNFGSPGARVMDSCEPPWMSPRNWTWILHKNSKYSEPSPQPTCRDFSVSIIPALWVLNPRCRLLTKHKYCDYTVSQSAAHLSL